MTSQPVILQILPALNSGGVERGTIEMNRAIVQVGWKSIVVSSGGKMEPQIRYDKGEHITLPVKEKRPLTIYRNINRLYKIIKEHKVDLIHARSRVPAWSAYYAAKKADIPLVTTFHGVYSMEGLFKRQYNSIMTKGQRVIAVSRYIQNHLLECYPDCPPDNIHVIHRGADMKRFHPDNVKPGILAQLAQSWHLAEDHDPIIMLPSRLSRWKGHEVLIDALARLPKRDFICLILGDKDDRKNYMHELQERVQQRGLTNCVRFVGSTRHMTEAYALADIIVTPSIRPEAFGRVSVEAQAMGKALVTSNHGGAQETVRANHTGFLVPPSDVGELAHVLQRLLEMPAAMRATIGRDAMEYVRDNFSIESMQQQTLDVYHELLNP